MCREFSNHSLVYMHVYLHICIFFYIKGFVLFLNLDVYKNDFLYDNIFICIFLLCIRFSICMSIYNIYI